MTVIVGARYLDLVTSDIYSIYTVECCSRDTYSIHGDGHADRTEYGIEYDHVTTPYAI